MKTAFIVALGVLAAVIVATTCISVCNSWGNDRAETFDTESVGMFRFYKLDGCGHCKKFEPTFESLKEPLGELGLKTEVIEASKEPGRSMAKEENISGFPTLQLRLATGKAVTYPSSSPRTVEGIMEWVKNNM